MGIWPRLDKLEQFFELWQCFVSRSVWAMFSSLLLTRPPPSSSLLIRVQKIKKNLSRWRQAKTSGITPVAWCRIIAPAGLISKKPQSRVYLVLHRIGNSYHNAPPGSLGTVLHLGVESMKEKRKIISEHYCVEFIHFALAFNALTLILTSSGASLGWKRLDNFLDAEKDGDTVIMGTEVVLQHFNELLLQGVPKTLINQSWI